MLHRDLKPGNLLINSSTCEVRLCDLGLGRCEVNSLAHDPYHDDHLIDVDEEVSNADDNGFDAEMTEVSTYIQCTLLGYILGYILEHQRWYMHRGEGEGSDGGGGGLEGVTVTVKLGLELGSGVLCNGFDASPYPNPTIHPPIPSPIHIHITFTSAPPCCLVCPAVQYVVTRPYRAPEVMLNPRHYNRAIDVWSLGVIFGDMLGRAKVSPVLL